MKEKEEAAAKAEMDLARYIATETVKDPQFNTCTLSDRSRKASQWLLDMEAAVAAVDAGDGTARAEQNKVSRLFSKDYLDFPGAICVETYRNMMDAAMEDAKTRIMLADGGRRHCAKVLHAEGTRAEQDERLGPLRRRLKG